MPVRAALLAALGDRAEEVELEIDHASFSWKHMVLELEGLQVGLPGIETQVAHAQVALAPWRRGNARVRWASVEGGRVVAQRDLLDRLDELLEAEDDGERGELPPIVLRDLVLAALDRDGRQEELAVLDLDLHPSPGSRWPKANLALRGIDDDAQSFLELVADAEGSGRWRLFVSAPELDLSR